jgi:hypothetical protein
MRYIKLFENFDANVGKSTDLIFDWMPFDDQITNPLQSSIPAELNGKDLGNFLVSLKESTTDLRSGDLEKAGLFMAHKKTGDGGFTRYITKTLSPLSFDVAVFDREFKQIGNFENVPGNEMDFGAYTRAVSGISRFTQNDDDDDM